MSFPIEKLQGLLGILAIIALAWALSEHRRAIRWGRVVLLGLALQVVFALIVLRVPAGERAIEGAGEAVKAVLNCARDGAKFLFGPIAPVGTLDGKDVAGAEVLPVFAFLVLPVVIFVAALSAVLYEVKLLQAVIWVLAKGMKGLMKASGAESLNVAASLFLGQTEAPLTIKPFLPRLTRSELMTVMTSGMAHVAGSVMAAYFSFGAQPKHILAAVVMTAPGTILLAKMLVPETEVPETADGVPWDAGEVDKDARRPLVVRILEAIAVGAKDGLSLALNIAAMLIAFIALIALVNLILGLVGTSLQQILGVVLWPVAWLLGVPSADCRAVGQLLGTRTVINEFLAFQQLGAMRSTLGPKSFTIATFALCGFANFSSIGIQIGGIGALAPGRRPDLADLGFKALLAGTLANFLSACIAGVLL